MNSYGIKQSLRYRVAVALATFSIFIVGTLCIILYFLSDNIEEAHIEQVIDMEMDHLIRCYQKHSDFNSQVGLHVRSFVISNMDDELQIPAYLRGLNPGLHRILYNTKELHIFVRIIGETKFLVAYRIELHTQRLKKLRLSILLSWIIVIAISFIVGYLLAKVLVRQVTDLAERVNLLAPGVVGVDLLARPEMDEEVAQLASALDDYQARIKRML